MMTAFTSVTLIKVQSLPIQHAYIKHAGCTQLNIIITVKLTTCKNAGQMKQVTPQKQRREREERRGQALMELISQTTAATDNFPK